MANPTTSGALDFEKRDAHFSTFNMADHEEGKLLKRIMLFQFI
jgi:hypothetical protein